MLSLVGIKKNIILNIFNIRLELCLKIEFNLIGSKKKNNLIIIKNIKMYSSILNVLMTLAAFDGRTNYAI